MEFTRVAIAQLRWKTTQKVVQFRWISIREPILHALVSSAAGEWQPMIMYIWIYCSIDLVLHIYITEAEMRSKLIGHRSCAAWKNSAFEWQQQWCHSCKHPSAAAFCGVCRLPLTTATALSCKPAIKRCCRTRRDKDQLHSMQLAGQLVLLCLDKRKHVYTWWAWRGSHRLRWLPAVTIRGRMS